MWQSQFELTINHYKLNWSYPAHGQLQLQLCQPPADAHPLSDAEGNMGERVDGAVLPQPSLRFELLPLIKILLIGAQRMSIYHQNCLQIGENND